MKTEVYSWRLSPALKGALEDAAREERVSVARLIERLVSRGLTEQAAGAGGAREARARAAAMRFIGVLQGGDPRRAERARRRIRARLVKRRAR
jgi:hypothetical protein